MTKASETAAAPKNSRPGYVKQSIVCLGLLVLAGTGALVWYFVGGAEDRALLARIPKPNIDRLSGRATELFESCEHSIRVNPRDASGWGILGRAYLSHDYAEEALVCFEVASELEPENYEWYYSQVLALPASEQKKSIELLRIAIPLCQEGLDQLQCHLGELLFDEAKYDECKNITREVLDKYPRHPRANLLMARVCLIRNEIEESLACAEKVISLEPNRRQALRLLSQIHIRLGNEKQSSEYSKKALDELAVDEPWPHPVSQKIRQLRKDVNQLVMNALRLPPSKVKERIRVLQEAVESEPKEPIWHGLLGQTYLQTRQFDRARQAMENGFKTCPESPVLRYIMGLVYLNEGNYPKAIHFFQEAISLKADYDQAYLNLGIAYRENGEPGKSIKALEESLAILPGSLKTKLNLAVSLEADKQTDKAIEVFKQCIDLDEQSAEVNFLLGKLLAKSGENIELGKQHLRRAVELEPEFAEAKELLDSLK